MYRGKSKQRGLIRSYHQEMDDKATPRRALARDLQGAAGRNEFCCTISCRRRCRRQAAAPKR